MNSFLTFAQEFISDQIKSNQKFTLPYVKISLWLWCSPYFRKYLCYKIICNLDMKILVAKEIFSWSICTIGWYHIWRIIIIYEIFMICTCIHTYWKLGNLMKFVLKIQMNVYANKIKIGLWKLFDPFVYDAILANIYYFCYFAPLAVHTLLDKVGTYGL